MTIFQKRSVGKNNIVGGWGGTGKQEGEVQSGLPCRKYREIEACGLSGNEQSDMRTGPIQIGETQRQRRVEKIKGGKEDLMCNSP